ncbi:Fpg/Nei family DNA glycosylase [Kribbella sp.]|uniref:Fpg/Nei family DNA glycosylase n=1 Tax=Kribbella sp. TaxID=1871183 RepID=UPI002D4B3A26|nr:DNA-formamidopyrimidine glycosylase family protein [Kribbella sp.]HZX06644.1 DNA-formamidopyrimidine glycosylase family protein [Kribbella sp.]
MPEGHTLHRLANDVWDAFGGRVVRASSPQGRFAEGAALLDGHVLRQTEAHGKHFLADFEGGGWLHIHLGLIGKMDIRPAPVPEPVGAVRLRLQNATSYADLRGATVCEVITDEERDKLLGRLGPDPLRDDADPEAAWKRIHRSKLPIGQLLMNQDVLSGVGNVYRAEVLFRAKLNPMTPGNVVKKREWQGMWEDLLELMKYGVETGRIDTVADDHTPEAMGRDPRRDDHGGEVYVYRRQGQRCHVCQSVIRTKLLAGRNLFWCPKCQRTGLTRKS